MSDLERRRWWQRQAIRFWGPVWARDLWLLAITGVTVWALVVGFRQQRQIQQERARATWMACVDQNHRHDTTVLRLRQLVAQIPAGRQRDRALHNVAGTVALINALAPKQDCRALVKRRVSTP